MADQPDMSRRRFLLGRASADRAGEFRAASNASPSIRDRPFPMLRPPGAIAEERFLQECTRCDACLKACAPGAIMHAPLQFRSAAGTPMIDPSHKPCMMCDGFPCIKACEPGVLRADLPARMGEARVSMVDCLAYQGSFCTVCSEHCPVEGAIDVIEGRPRINAELCTGCGICQHVCPAPVNAVLMLPTPARPDVPARPKPECLVKDESASASSPERGHSCVHIVPTGAPGVTPTEPASRQQVGSGNPAGEVHKVEKPPAPWELDMNLVTDPFAQPEGEAPRRTNGDEGSAHA